MYFSSMEKIDFIDKARAIVLSMVINTFSALILYGFICRIPLHPFDLMIAAMLWIIYCGFIHILFLLTMLEGRKTFLKIFQSVTGIIFIIPLVIAFHSIGGGFHFNDFPIKIELTLSILIAAETPYFISYITRKSYSIQN